MQKSTLISTIALLIFLTSCNLQEDKSIVPYDNDNGLSRSQFKANLNNPELRNKPVPKKRQAKLLPILSEQKNQK